MQEAYHYLKEKLIIDNIIVAAISGGPDSMALLDLLLSIKKERNIKIVVAHVNHNVRKESESEKIFVENYCTQNNIIFEYMKIKNYTNNKFSELEARKIRYDFFSELITKYNAKYLLTAHHGDDLIETILMRIVRGASLKGYSGFKIESKFKNYAILRPLINATKEEILNYLENKNIKYVIDSSNEKDLYTRNRYRKYILPILKKENKLVHLKFKQFSETIIENDNYIEKQALIFMYNIYKDKLNISEFLKLDNIIQKRIINIILEKEYSDNINILNNTHVESILNLIKNNKNSSINLPNNKIAIKEYNYLQILTSNNDIFDFCLELKEENILKNGKKIKIIEQTDSDSNFICRLNKNEVKFPLYIRNKKNGDKMDVKGLNGTKKISDIFIDSKMPKLERNSHPVVIDSEGVIVWLPGVKKSKFDRTKDEKYDIILKYD